MISFAPRSSQPVRIQLNSDNLSSSTKQAMGTIPLQTPTPMWTPGPPGSAQTASSFTFSAPSQPSTAATLLSSFSIPSSGRARAVSAGPDPNADGGDKARFYAVPEWQKSPDAEIDEIPLPSWLSVGNLVATAHEAPAAGPEKTVQNAAQALTNRATHPPPPASPRNHLQSNAWSLGDYFLLLSVMCVHAHAWSRGAPIDWEHVADIVNSYVRPRVPFFTPPTPHPLQGQGQLALFGQVTPRWTAWDCWHRWTVPWVSPRGEAPKCDMREESEEAKGAQDEGPTFEDALGVQHRYAVFDMARTIEVYALLTRVLTVLDDDPSGLLKRDGTGPVPASTTTAKRLGPARHPAYPARTQNPNVPPRTFGNVQAWGLMPWFRKGAVNVTTLEALFQGRPGAAAEDRPGCVAERILPRHLRELRVPPPPAWAVGRRYGKVRSDGEVR